MRSFSLFALAGLCVSLLLTGCGFGTQAIDLGVPNTAVGGQLQGGQAPITGATIGIYAFGTGGYGSPATLLAYTTTDSSGNFTFAAGAWHCPQSNTPLYLLSLSGNTGGGNNPAAVLGLALGPCGSLSGTVVINEVTTAALAFSLAHYFNEINSGYTQGADSFGGPSSTTGGVTTYSQGIISATTATLPAIVNKSYGGANSSVNAAPGSIIEAAKIYTIANILAACVNTTGPTSSTETTTPCGQLFGYTMDYANTRPTDTLQAAVQMALYPTAHVRSLYNLIPPIGFAFANYLTTQPNDFSIGVSYTTASASLAVPTAAIATLDIDTAGNVWFPSNGPGQVGLVRFYPTGSTGFNGPYNSTGMVKPTQVAIDSSQVAWLNDSGSSVLSGYQISTPANATSFSLAGTTSTALTINDDNSVVTGILAGSSPMLASLNTARNAYTAVPNSALDYAAVSVAGDAVGGDSVSTTNTVSGAGMSLYYDGPYPLSNYHAVPVASDTGLAGQTIFQGSDFVALNTSINTSTDDLCVFTLQKCYSIYPQAQKPTNLVIDGYGALWASAGSAAALMEIPQYSTFAPGGASYLDTKFNPARAEAYELLHGTGNGGTMVRPAAIGVDVVGNVWMANAGCTTTGCTPTQFVLSEVIGAAAPTITPVVNQIITNSTLTGTQPNY